MKTGSQHYIYNSFVFIIFYVKSEQNIVDQILDLKFWKTLWDKIEQSLDSEYDKNNLMQEKNSIKPKPPNWSLISPVGYLEITRIALRLMTMSTQNCFFLLTKDTSNMFDVLSYMISVEFIHNIKKK